MKGFNTQFQDKTQQKNILGMWLWHVPLSINNKISQKRKQSEPHTHTKTSFRNHQRQPAPQFVESPTFYIN